MLMSEENLECMFSFNDGRLSPYKVENLAQSHRWLMTEPEVKPSWTMPLASLLTLHDGGFYYPNNPPPISLVFHILVDWLKPGGAPPAAKMACSSVLRLLLDVALLCPLSHSG